MSIDGDGKKLGELNHQLEDENKRFENVVNEDDIEVNDSTENINYRHEGALQAPQAALQTCQRQQLKGSVDCWEKFLHLRSVKVLLVESDYSTRHVVNALLRNCYYEVIEAADGLQAWKMLEDLTIQIDLVLTEVDMPGLSGLGLLYKIMSHRTRNNVPVIMMSSHDSMGLVFKCLSKGAVDFLVKPIRKNELKNVWQHVWRRCRSSSESGSESGTHTQKSVRSKSAKKCDNNTGSIDENDNGSMGLSVEDGSDNSSWTKQAVEDSSRSASPEDQIAEGPDSTCAQVIFSNAEVSGNKQTSIIKVKECERCKEQLDDEPDKDEEKVVLGNIVSQFIHQFEDPNPNCAGPFPKSTAIEASTRQPPISDSNMKASDDADGTPYFEHGFKRVREEKDVETDQNVPKRSDSTAFSRKSGRPLDSASGETVKTRKEPVLDLESHLNIDHSNRFSNVGSYSATKGDDLCAPQQILPKNADDAGIRKIQNHLCNHHGMQQPELSPDHADASLKKMAEVVPLCGSSYVYGGPAEGSGGNYHSVNESVSGSNHGSNQGSNTVVNNGGINIESGSGDGSGSGSGNRVDQNKFSRREAALAKFPENRKERFFQKKVRHQTRKKRGQIVRQTTNESSSEGSES